MNRTSMETDKERIRWKINRGIRRIKKKNKDRNSGFGTK